MYAPFHNVPLNNTRMPRRWLLKQISNNYLILLTLRFIMRSWCVPLFIVYRFLCELYTADKLRPPSISPMSAHKVAQRYMYVYVDAAFVSAGKSLETFMTFTHQLFDKSWNFIAERESDPSLKAVPMLVVGLSMRTNFRCLRYNANWC